MVLLLCCGVSHAQTAAEYNATGVGYYEAGHWDEAIAAFSSAYELMPRNDTIRHNLCNAYQAAANASARAGDYREACRLAETAVGVLPESASPLVQLASYYLRLNHATQAIYRLEEAVQLDPDNVDARDLLGDAFYKENDLPSALAEWELVLELQPGREGLRKKLEKAYRENAVETGFREDRSRHFRISYGRKTDGRTRRSVLTILERAYRDIGRKLGNVFPPTPVQVIVYTAEGFSEATLMGEHVGAVYDGKIRVPLQDRNGVPIDADELERRLYHEYVHVVVRFWLGDEAPWWLNEGLAETLSKELSPSDIDLLQAARDDGLLFSLRTLEPAQMEALAVQDFRLAYAQSHATVRFLWNRFGQRPMAEFLNSLARGVPVEDTLRATYNRTYDVLEKEVAHNLGNAPR